MTYKATVLRIKTGQIVGSRPFEDAGTAATHLVLLMHANGFKGDKGEAARTLAQGEPLAHKGFEYRVAEVR